MVYHLLFSLSKNWKKNGFYDYMMNITRQYVVFKLRFINLTLTVFLMSRAKVILRLPRPRQIK